MAAKANIVIDQGTTFSTFLALTDDNNDIIDLTDYTARGQIRKWYTSNSHVDFTVEILEPTTGNIYISLDADTTAALEAGRYVYDIETVDPDTNVTRIVEGIVTVTPEVTKL
jgi:hypothetical protein